MEKEMGTHYSILAWEIPRTEEPGGLQSMGLQKSQTQLSTKQQQQSYVYNDVVPLFSILMWLLAVTDMLLKLCLQMTMQPVITVTVYYKILLMNKIVNKQEGKGRWKA